MYLNDSARVFHVSKAGNDSNGGVAQQYPVSLANDSKLTIGAAITAASSGDTIIIWPGTYAEQIDMTSVDKALTYIGANRKTTIIKAASGATFISPRDGTTFKNITLDSTNTAVQSIGTVSIFGSVKLYFEDCDILSDNIGIDAGVSQLVSLKNCYMFAKASNLWIGTNAILDNCFIACDATDAQTWSAAIVLGEFKTDGRLIIRNSVVYVKPSYNKDLGGKFATLYESNKETCYIIIALYSSVSDSRVVIDNCLLIADGYKPTGANGSSYAIGDYYGICDITNLSMKNSVVVARTDQNQSSQVAKGIVNSNAALENCSIEVSSAGTGGTAYDFDAASAKATYLANTKYNSAQIGSNITLEKSDIGRWLGTAPAALGADGKMLLSTTGLDAVLTTEPSGAPSGWNFREWLCWLFRRFSNKTILNSGTGTLKVRNDVDDADLSSQNVTEAAGVQTMNKAE